MNIKSWEEKKIYKEFKKEVCTQEIFESRLFDKKGASLGEYGTTHSTTLFTHLALFRYFLNQKELISPKKTPVFLDLGSGVGNILIYASHQGWKAIGIEFSKECCNASKENIKKAEQSGYIQRNNIEIIHSNFFPKKFKIKKLPKNKKEDDFREDLDKCEKKCSKKIKPEFFKEIDLFYHYQVERRQNILNFFSEYAKEKAILVYVATKKDNFKLPENIIEMGNYLGMHIYQKSSNNQ